MVPRAVERVQQVSAIARNALFSKQRKHGSFSGGRFDRAEALVRPDAQTNPPRMTIERDVSLPKNSSSWPIKERSKTK